MLIRTDWNNSIHVDENYNRVQDIIRQFKGRCTEISCHIGEKQFFLNPEDNGNINEAEFYIKTTDNESLKVLVGDITAYIKKNYPEARVEPAKVENLFEQLFKGEDAPLIIYLSGESARKIEELSKINAFIDHLNEEMPGLKLNKPAVQERIVVHILPERLALYKVNQNVLLNTLEKNISKVSIGKLNTGNLYIPIVITENEHTIRDILNEVYVSNSDRKYICLLYTSPSPRD